MESFKFPEVKRNRLTTLQVNIGYRCNQQCAHCHVDAGPNRLEMMSSLNINLIPKVLELYNLKSLDITGGAPEIHPQFRELVLNARNIGIEVIDRCNLTILNEPGHEDLAETISLAHDLGHTPFGHAGQDALNKCMKKYGGFEHNLQSLRIVDNLEKRYADFNGLNLMFDSREGILKHCSLRNAKKLGAIGDRFIRKQQPSIEAQIVNIADEIAYINHDIDDGFRSGLLSVDALMTNALFKLCANDVYSNFPKIDDEIFINEVVRRMINLMVSDLITTSKDNIHKFNPTSPDEVRAMPSLVKFSLELFKSKQEIKSFLRKSLYEHQQVKDMTNNAQHIIKILFDYFKDDPKRIPKDFKKDTTDEFERTVSDYIAGMTDRYAIQLYNNLI